MSSAVIPNFFPQRIAPFVHRHRVLLLILLAHGLAWSALNAVLVPHPDYIDHWMQGRQLSWSYFEHPPMVAWLIRALTLVFGTSQVGLELAALAVSMAVLTAAYGLACDLGGVRAGIFTVLALESTVMFMVKSATIQTEQPLALSWLLGLWALTRYVRGGRARWLLLAGVAGGLGALSKYTMILFYLGWMTYVTLVPGRRREWWNPLLYAAGLISLAMFSPVLWWNATHEWLSFRFQLAKGSAEDAVFGVTSLVFLVGTWAAFSPVLSAWGWVRSLRRWQRQDGVESLLIVMAWVPLLFFVVTLARGAYPDPHWAVPAMVTLYVWLGVQAARLWEAGARHHLRRIYGAALLVNAVMMLAIFVHVLTPWIEGQVGGDRGDEVLGWDETVRRVEVALAARDISPPAHVISFFYPLAVHFSLHMSSQPLSMSLERPARNLWIDPAQVKPDNTIVVCDSDPRCRWTRRRVPRYTDYRVGPRLFVVRHRIRGIDRRIQVFRLVPKAARPSDGAPRAASP